MQLNNSLKNLGKSALLFSSLAYLGHHQIRKMNTWSSDSFCPHAKLSCPGQGNKLFRAKVQVPIKPPFYKACDELFTQLAKRFELGEDLQELFALLQTRIQAIQTEAEAEYVAKKIISWLRALSFFGSIESLICFVYYRAHPASSLYSECEIEKMLRLSPLFALVNQLIPHVKEKKRVDELKILLANLPFEGSRETFASLFLSEKEEIAILIEAFQQKEDLLVNEIVEQIKTRDFFLTPSEDRILHKCLFPQKKSNWQLETALSQANREKLQEALHQRNLQPKRSEIFSSLQKNYEQLRSWEKKEFACLPESPAKLLQRMTKCKKYFQEVNLRTNSSPNAIPYWYHACNASSLAHIAESGYLKFSYKRGNERGYTGAWVSSLVDSYLFGFFVVGFTRAIEEKNSETAPPNKIHYFPHRRWRGLMENVDLKNAVFFSVKTEVDKCQEQKNKEELQLKLKKKNISSHYKIISEKQLYFLQKQVESILGHPNMTPSF